MATTNQADKPARKKPGVRQRKAAAAKGAATRAANKATAGSADSASTPAAPAAKPVVPALRELGTQAVIDASNERGTIIARAEYLHHGGVAQYLLGYMRADGCYDERWFAAGQLVDYVERRKRA
jgi:hypothetical protein